MTTALENWLAAQERDSAWLQRRLKERGVARTHQAVRRIVTGKQIPNRAIGRAIIEITDGAISAGDFYADPGQQEAA